MTIKPLDIVRTPKGGLAMVTEADRGGVSVDFLEGCNPGSEHNSWWSAGELVVLDSIPRLLANATAHPMGRNKNQGGRFFPLEKPE